MVLLILSQYERENLGARYEETPPTYLIEIKSTIFVNANHTMQLNRYTTDFPNSIPMVISLDKTRTKIDKTLCLHWTEALRTIGEGA